MPAAGYDTGIGLFTGTNLSPTWLAGVDIALGGGLESFSVPVTTSQTYHFVVDSFYASTNSLSQGATPSTSPAATASHWFPNRGRR